MTSHWSHFSGRRTQKLCQLLRAQAGWNLEDEWIDAAAYSLDELLQGVLIKEEDPVPIESLDDFINRNRFSRSLYHSEMFGGDVDPGTDYEVLAIPLHFSEDEGPLGTKRSGETLARESNDL